MVNRTSLITFVTLLILVLLLGLRMIAPYILSLLMGGILALLMNPLYRRLRQDNTSPKAASLVLTIALIILVVGPLAALSVLAVRQGMSIAAVVQANESFSFNEIMTRLAHWKPVEAIVGDPAALEAQVRQGLRGLGQIVSGVVLGLAANVPEIVLQVFLAVMTCFFLLVDGRRFVAWVQDKIPLDEEVRRKIVSSFQNTTVSVIWATLAAAGAQAVCMIGGFLALGVPGAVLAGGATFVFAWIPILGSTPVWLAGAIYLYAQGATAKMIIMIGIGVFTGIIDNFVRPWVLAGRDETHPLVSLVAIFGGIQMFGIFGVFIGPIVVAILLAMLEIWPTLAQRFGLMSSASATLVDASGQDLAKVPVRSSGNESS